MGSGGIDRETAIRRRRQRRFTATRKRKQKMQLSYIPLYGLVLILNMQLFSAHPIISNGLTSGDIDVLKVLLHRLEEAVPERGELERVPVERLDEETAQTEEEDEQLQASLDEAAIREFLSAKNLKTVRNDSSRRASGCFGRRMDRIGSMSSLGCNTVGRFNPKRR